MTQDRESHPHAHHVSVDRRSLLRAGATAGGAFFVMVAVPGLVRRMPGADTAEAATDFAPNAFVRIDRGGEVTLVMPQVEMGQGTYTALPMLVAEELEIDPATVRLEHAPANDKLYGNPLLGFQVTGGSTSVPGFWEPLRRAGAAARTMLVAAAADTWNVDPATCRAAGGSVMHGPTGRALTYGALVDRAATVPVPASVTLKDPSEFTLIGKPIKRLDGADKVDGKAMYGIDVRLPGMKFAAVAICPIVGGRLLRVDDSKTKAVRGVRQIVQIEEAVAVVADHMGAARKGLDALDITWDEGPNAKLTTADMVRDLAEAVKRQGVTAEREGDVDRALAEAATKVEAIYQAPFLAHATMEPMNYTVHVRDDACDVWGSTQVMSRAQAIAAQAAGLPPERVTMHNHLLGGGFGRKLDVDAVELAVRLGKQVEGPVKFVWSREEDTQHDVYRPYYYDRLAGGLDRDGNVTAFSHRVAGSSILARWAPPVFVNGLDRDAVEAASGPYSFPNLLVDYVRQEPPSGITTAWWRGVGVTHNAFMVEGFIDELAAAARKDPVEFRRGLLGKAPRARAVLDLAAEKAGWGRPLPAGQGRGVSVVFGFGTYVAQIAEVSVGPDGHVRVNRVVCAVDCGHMVNPDVVKAQMEGGVIFGVSAALLSEITFKDGRVEQGNFDTYPVLRIDEAPAVEVYLVDSREKPGGMGEPGTATIAPAIVNAVFAATGKRLRKLPIDAAALKSA